MTGINLKKLHLTLISPDLEVNDCGFNFDVPIGVFKDIIKPCIVL